MKWTNRLTSILTERWTDLTHPRTKDVVDLAMDDRVGSNADHSSRMGAEGKTKSARQSPKYRRPSTKVHNIAASLGDLKKGLKK